jgi:hypothetical protein
MKKVNYFKKYSLPAILLMSVAITSCKKDDVAAPKKENEEEVITDVKLIFTNAANPLDIITARAKDPDGAGVKELEILDKINLDTNKTYVLSLQVMNNLEIPGEDITKEILKEANDHQFFYSFTKDAFSNPAGDGNIDNAKDATKYNDFDQNKNPIGLSTTWTTNSSVLKNGKFKVRLQHQPNIKSATTGSSDGDTDFELEFDLIIE